MSSSLKNNQINNLIPRKARTHTATLVPGLNFTCLRLHGRIEGNVNELCAQLEKSRPIKVESGNSNKKKRRSDYDSPHAAPVRRRYIDMNDDTDGGEDRIGVFRRKLSDDFDRIIYSSMRFSTNIESEQEHKIWDQWRIFRSLKDVLQWTLFLLWLEYCINQRLFFNPCLCQEMALWLKTSLVNWYVMLSVLIPYKLLPYVGSVPDLTEHLHMTTARILRHYKVIIGAYLLSELRFRYSAHGIDALKIDSDHSWLHCHLICTKLFEQTGIPQEVQNLLLEYGIEIFAETLVEGLSRIKICTDEGRALMSLDIQLYCTSLSSTNVKPKLQIVDTFIKAYYPPGMEYVHWARAHPVVGLVTLVATMKGWKRKTRLELVDKIEAAAA
ncbi:hypothetical protein HID58_079966 [Brassica napus]|uniref:Syndetin C-terminal domain-containing protein n=1 Tax=Brassica napus TaxID=3708 RepID=A0ABQ7Y6L5_BRANA|nr:hypothetical protein HID58_079966 [Brassica napus]